MRGEPTWHYIKKMKLIFPDFTQTSCFSIITTIINITVFPTKSFILSRIFNFFLPSIGHALYISFMKNLIHELREDKRLLIILLCILLASIIAAGLMIGISITSKQLQYENNLNYGYASMSAQDYEEAIRAFETAYRTDPTDDAAIGLAKAWFASGSTEKAIQVVTSRMELYESTDELNALLEEYKEAIGY